MGSSSQLLMKSYKHGLGASFRFLMECYYLLKKKTKSINSPKSWSLKTQLCKSMTETGGGKVIFITSCQGISIQNLKIQHEEGLKSCKSTDPESLSPNSKTFTFIVHDSTKTIEMIQRMQSEMAKTIHDITTEHPEWITTFNLLYFTTKVITQPVETKDPNVFLKAFKDFADRNYYNTTEASCKNLPVLSSLYVHLAPTLSPQPNSNIYVFMNGIIGDYNDALYTHLRDLIIQTGTKINFIQTNPYPCGEALTSEGPQMMWNISSLSGGEVFVISPNTVPALMKTFQFQYQNSIIAEGHFEDCSKEQIFKIPIDSQTQAVTVLIDGELYANYPEYLDSEGYVITAYIYNSFEDYSTNSRFDQIVGACDANEGYFEYMNGRCWGYNFYSQTWMEARNNCNSYGGALVDILDDIDQQTLYQAAGTVSYWTGLNDLEHQGKFEWYQNQNSSIPLSYTNWGQGEPNIDIGGCVADSMHGKWQVKNCNDRKLSICARNYYDPSIDSPNNVQPGVWAVKLKTYQGSCSIKVTTQSNIFVYPAFVQDVKDDIGAASPISGTNNYVIAHVDGLFSSNGTKTGSLKTVTFSSSKTSFSMKVHLRDSKTCKHEFISEAFKCAPGNYKITFTGVDSNGYEFTRIHPAHCSNASVNS